MKKLIVFQTYYKEEQYKEYQLDKLPEFVQVINTNTYDYPHKELNPFWSEYIFMKYVFENIDKYDCEYIGFDQYKNHFDYDKVFEVLNKSDNVCIINRLEQVNAYQQYVDSHNKHDIDKLLDILEKNNHEVITKFFTYGKVPFFWGSCFIMKKDMFIKMCQVIFPVLNELDKEYHLKYDVKKYMAHFKKSFANKNNYSETTLKNKKFGTYEYQRRCFGYLAERILSSWIILNFSTREQLHTIPLKKEFKHNRNVVFISHDLTRTGAPRALFNFAKCLTKNGYTAVVLSPKDGPLSYDYEKEGIRCVVIKDLLAKFRTYNDSLFKILNWSGYIVCNTIVTAFYSLFMKDVTAKKILWIHEGTFAYKVYKKIISPAILREFDEIYTVGEYSQGITSAYCSKPINILNYFIDDNYHKKAYYPEVTDNLYIAVIGSVGARKGSDLVLSALKELSPEEREHIFIYYIGGPDGSEIYGALKKHDLKNIRLIGSMPHEKTLDFLSICNVLLCPSRDDPMPICCTEAFMMHKPVIVSTKTGTAPFIKDSVNGFVVEPDGKSIAQGIRRVLQNKSKLKQIGNKGRKIFDTQFTEQIFETNMIKIFET